MAKRQWISETEAMKLAGYTNNRSFRRKVKAKELKIDYTYVKSKTGRKMNYQYNELDIQRQLELNAVPAEKTYIATRA